MRKADIKRNIEIKEVIVNKYNIPDDIFNEEIDLNSLKQENSDVVAYIDVRNTNIKNVVVKAEDNDYYLHHNFLKEENGAGWVFADYRDKFDGTDKNIIIYGHNMLDGSSLGTLKNVLTEEWYTNEDNLYIPLVTEREKMVYKVFSVYQIEEEDYYIETDFTKINFLSFLHTIKDRSIHSFDTELDQNSSILTLSTCTERDDERTVLHAIRIK